MVSAHVSPRERNPGLLGGDAARVFNRSRVERARRSSRVTISTSPASSWSSARRSWARSVLAPLAVSRNTCLASGGAELAHLGVNALAVRRDSCIAVNHGVIMHQIYATKKPFLINGLVLVQNS